MKGLSTMVSTLRWVGIITPLGLSLKWKNCKWSIHKINETPTLIRLARQSCHHWLKEPFCWCPGNLKDNKNNSGVGVSYISVLVVSHDDMIWSLSILILLNVNDLILGKQPVSHSIKSNIPGPINRPMLGQRTFDWLLKYLPYLPSKVCPRI